MGLLEDVCIAVGRRYFLNDEKVAEGMRKPEDGKDGFGYPEEHVDDEDKNARKLGLVHAMDMVVKGSIPTFGRTVDQKNMTDGVDIGSVRGSADGAPRNRSAWDGRPSRKGAVNAT